MARTKNVDTNSASVHEMVLPDVEAKKFRPERTIFLNESNTGFKTKDQVLLAITKLRTRAWLVTYGEKVRPVHLSFNDDMLLTEFRRDCDAFGISIKTPKLSEDELDALFDDDKKGVIMPDAVANESYQDPEGKIHIGTAD